MNDQRPDPPLQPKYTVTEMLMTAVGFVLLMPGACALLFLPAAFEGYAPVVLPVALVCFLISGGGIWMMIAARRSAIATAQAEASDRDGRP